MELYFPLIVMFLLFVVNAPVAFALLISGMTYFIFFCDDIPMDLLIQAMVGATESYPLLAIPFFITAGVIMSYSGIARSLLAMAEVLTGHMTGGLGQVNVLLSTFMGGVSGSPIADAAFQSKVLVPEMERMGYSKPFSAAITATSSVITPIIPPGICLIIYATGTNQSIGDIFMAGYVPGLLMCAFLMVVVHIVSTKRRYLPSRQRRANLGEVVKQAKRSVWALALPFGIIFGLRLGFFTPTECGAMTVAYSLFVGFFVYRELRWRDLPRIMIEAVLSTAMVMFIMTCAALFSRYLNWERIPYYASTFLMNLTSSKIMFLIIVNLFLLVMGMFFDANAALIIFPPLLAPVAAKLGVDLIQFGILMCLNITIGGVTPPFGILMFTVCGITRTSLTAFIKESLPFLGALLAVLALVTFVPQVPLFAVNLFK